MKKNIFLLFILLGILFDVYSQTAEEKEAKLFANKLFYAVKKNDLEGFKKLSMVLQDWEKLVAQSPKLSKDEKQTIMAAGKADILEYHERKKFDKMQKTAKREFIDWSQIKIDSMTHSIEKRGTIKVLTFNLYFHFEQRAFVFNSTDCIKTLTGWKMSKGADITLLSK